MLLRCFVPVGIEPTACWLQVKHLTAMLQYDCTVTLIDVVNIDDIVNVNAVSCYSTVL